jgi:hypothetical protein
MGSSRLRSKALARRPSLRRHQEGVVVVAQHVPEAVDARGDEGFLHRHRLEYRERRSFPERRKDGDIESGEGLGDVALEPGETSPAGDAKLPRLRFELAKKRPSPRRRPSTLPLAGEDRGGLTR